MAPPIVNPHAPAAPTARIWSSEATEPATMTGPVAAPTTARMSDQRVWRKVPIREQVKPVDACRRRKAAACSAIARISPLSTLG
jgi:hypothetical protein